MYPEQQDLIFFNSVS